MPVWGADGGVVAPPDEEATATPDGCCAAALVAFAVVDDVENAPAWVNCIANLSGSASGWYKLTKNGTPL